MKITVFELLQSLKLVSRKIWVIEKYWNFHIVLWEYIAQKRLRIFHWTNSFWLGYDYCLTESRSRAWHNCIGNKIYMIQIVFTYKPLPRPIPPVYILMTLETCNFEPWWEKRNWKIKTQYLRSCVVG